MILFSSCMSSALSNVLFKYDGALMSKVLSSRLLYFQVTESGSLTGMALWFRLFLDRSENHFIDTQPGKKLPLS